MNANLGFSLKRSDELLNELLQAYTASLQAREVSPRAVHLTHELLTLLRSILDRTARAYWEKHISPTLDATDREKALIYFPVAPDQQSFDSTLGRWRWKGVRPAHQLFYDALLSLQPFQRRENQWLQVVSDIASHGKHIDLLPQTRTEQRVTTVTSRAGSISYTQGAIFSPGVKINGAMIDARTQRIQPTPGVADSVTVWVSFNIPGRNVDAGSLCRFACAEVRKIVESLALRFKL